MSARVRHSVDGSACVRRRWGTGMVVGMAGKRALAGRRADRFTHSGGNWTTDHDNHQGERPSASSHLIREYKSNVTGNAGIGGYLCTASGLERSGELNHGTCSRSSGLASTFTAVPLARLYTAILCLTDRSHSAPTPAAIAAVVKAVLRSRFSAPYSL